MVEVLVVDKEGGDGVMGRRCKKELESLPHTTTEGRYQ